MEESAQSPLESRSSLTAMQPMPLEDMAQFREELLEVSGSFYLCRFFVRITPFTVQYRLRGELHRMPVSALAEDLGEPLVRAFCEKSPVLGTEPGDSPEWEDGSVARKRKRQEGRQRVPPCPRRMAAKRARSRDAGEEPPRGSRGSWKSSELKEEYEEYEEEEEEEEGGMGPLCRCGEPAALKKVCKEGPNKGRKFWGCPLYDNGDEKHSGCKFFRWC